MTAQTHEEIVARIKAETKPRAKEDPDYIDHKRVIIATDQADVTI